MIENLENDIKKLLQGELPPEVDLASWNLHHDYYNLIEGRLLNPTERPKGTLRMSSLGVPCERKLWYSVNLPDAGEELDGETILKFLYGDVVEMLLIHLTKLSGHKVVYEQHQVDIEGIKGHIDCIIDGMLIDVKSCSPASFNKFKSGALLIDDPFGYISQLSSYLAALQENSEVLYKDRAGFLAFDKTNGRVEVVHL